ncbi:MAG TPA: hypothetical protein VEG37_05520 [Burkholderiales bacterium]|nr:hypothetical protein [Burkholderiales bacterium]
MSLLLRVILLSMPLLLFCASEAEGHGFAGKRFFPATLAVDDPFISDELSLEANHIREPEQVTNEFSVAYSKRITPNFGLEFNETYQHLEPSQGGSKNGFANLDVGAKYQFFLSAMHETILSIGFDAELGGTGSGNVADSFSTLSPGFFFGKGFGDLPESMKFLRPFAITGTIGPNIPTRNSNVTTTIDPITGDISQDSQRNPTTLTWGLTFQYNLQYLQSFVQDIGLKEPFNRMIPIVELPLTTCLNANCNGQTTGTVNPGIIWFGKYVQLGAEAQIPINQRTGNHVGVLLQLHFFIDDIFPQSLGRPLFR